MRNKDFAVFILTHGRPDAVLTWDTMLKYKYSGPMYLLIDNEDKKAEQYYKKFGRDKVIMFDKKAVAKTFDEFDNFEDRRAIVYARNIVFKIAKDMGFKHFIQLDDDYTNFSWRINYDPEDETKELKHPKIVRQILYSMDGIFDAFLDYYKSIDVASIAMSQGGDWFGGGSNFNKPPKRKAMNTFFCSTEKPFQFAGRINEDVNTYTWLQSQGKVFFTIPFVQMNQKQTQSNKGGMTDIYVDGGTYVKSFYTVICSPNCCSINLMGRTNRRLHHNINWKVAIPMIIDEKHKK